MGAYESLPMHNSMKIYWIGSNGLYRANLNGTDVESLGSSISGTDEKIFTKFKNLTNPDLNRVSLNYFFHLLLKIIWKHTGTHVIKSISNHN